VARVANRGNGQAASADAIEEALQLFRAGGGRITTARRLILTCLLAGEHPRTAADLASEVQALAPDVHISTIYRNLEELERFGLVAHAHLGHGPATYYLATQAHGHFVCRACGAVIEVPAQLFGALSEAAKLTYDFEIEPDHFAILGLCTSCITSGQPERLADGR